ncbi:ArsR family transcriptional regulator [Candidatus Bathyarchaeota archaeon]|nr:ArsR family transcriptional regulator [Candidatus Bathyarchaeota archaeon]
MFLYPVRTGMIDLKNMKHLKTISDPEAFKLMADETRRKIVFLLRAKEMTVSQIAQELNITPQTVYHHIKKLVEGNLVEVTREVRVDHLIESYYQATAEVFHFTVGKTSQGKEVLREDTEVALKALTRIGFKLKYDQKVISDLVELMMEQKDCCGIAEYEDAVSKLDDIDFFTKQNVQEYAGILSMSDEEFVIRDELRKKFRDLLRSLLVE